MSKLLPILSLSLAVCCCARAGTAADYFHRGAQFYVFGEKQKATSEVQTGLSLFPSDPALNELAQLLQKEEEQQQQQQQQQQNDSSSQNEQQSSESQSSENNQSQSESESSRQQDQDSSQPQPESSPDQQSPSNNGANPQDGRPEEPPEESETPATPGQMTPREARQLLDSQKGDERLLPVQPNQKTQRKQGPIKDW